MYDVNEYVRYGAKGIFQIQRIVERKDKKGRNAHWYALYSSKDGIETSIMTPADNEQIRKILDENAIHKLIQEMQNLDTVWEDNKTFRYQNFQEMLESGSARELAKLTKTIHFMQTEKESNGKQLAEKDREYLQRAETMLFEEIALSMGIDETQVLDYILMHV